MTITTTIEAEGRGSNPAGACVAGRIRGLHVQSGIKAADGSSFHKDPPPLPPGGMWINNHNQTRAASRTRGLPVKSGVKAGPRFDPYKNFKF